jgi:hypothetical protein
VQVQVWEVGLHLLLKLRQVQVHLQAHSSNIVPGWQQTDDAAVTSGCYRIRNRPGCTGAQCNPTATAPTPRCCTRSSLAESARKLQAPSMS